MREVVVGHVGQRQRLFHALAEHMGDGCRAHAELGSTPLNVAGKIICIAHVRDVCSHLEKKTPEDVSAQEGPGEMAEMQIAVGVGRCTRHDVAQAFVVHALTPPSASCAG